MELFELRVQCTGWAGLVGSSVMAEKHQAFASHATEYHGQRPGPTQERARHGRLAQSQTGCTQCKRVDDLQKLPPCFDLASRVPISSAAKRFCNTPGMLPPVDQSINQSINQYFMSLGLIRGVNRQ